MLTRDEILALASDVESDRVEHKSSLADLDRLSRNVCAFANDLPHHRAPGYLLIGIKDSGRLVGRTFSDAELCTLAGLRDNGLILPLPSIKVYKVEMEPGVEVAVVEVEPHRQPPVRYRGQICVRVGPRLAHASIEDEHALVERRHQNHLAWDEWLSAGATIGDLRMDHIREDYVPRRIHIDDPAELESRSDIDILDTLRLYYRGIHKDGPSHGAMLLFAREPRRFYRGLWLQFVRFEGDTRASKVLDDQAYEGDIFEQLRCLEKIEQHQRTVTRADGSEGLEYPVEAIREVVINAIMHRDYEQISPTLFYWFSDRIEVLNAGGLLSGVDPAVFARDWPPPGWSGRRTGYRNEVISEAMRTYGYVQKFGTGIPKVRTTLTENGSPHAFFLWNEMTFQATLYSATRPRLATEEDEVAWVLQREGNERVGPLMQSLEARLASLAEARQAAERQVMQAEAEIAEERLARAAAEAARAATEATLATERQARKAALKKANAEARRAAAEAERASAEAAARAAEARRAAAEAAARTAAEGKARQALAGMRASLHAIASARGLVLPEDLAARIEACEDAATLSRWLARAAVAATAEDMLAD